VTAAPEVSTTVYQRAPGVLVRAAGESLLLLVRGSEERLLELSGSGAALWRTLATPQSTDDCAASLAADYDMAEDAVRSAIAPVLDELAVRGALEVLRAPA
jgi:hypothetical protein